MKTFQDSIPRWLYLTLEVITLGKRYCKGPDCGKWEGWTYHGKFRGAQNEKKGRSGGWLCEYCGRENC